MNERRIATVLRVRALQERIARSEVVRRRLALETERRAEAAAWSVVRARSATVPPEASRFVGHRRMRAGGVADATRAADRAVEAVAAVDVALTGWRVEAQRLDGVERLVERVRADAAVDEARRQANDVDDLVVMRHRRER